MIDYHIATAYGAHRFEVEMAFTAQSRELFLTLPVWIPGSYTRRDFSKHLRDFQAFEADGRALNWTLLSPSRWMVEVPQEGASVRIRYNVYARDASVRGNYLDDERGVLNPCGLCLTLEGQEHNPHRLRLAFDESRSHWRAEGAALPFEAQNYDELIDTPFLLLSDARSFAFDVSGRSHEVFYQRIDGLDETKLRQDLQKICQTAHDLFGDFPAAVQHYRFLLYATEATYGGLEHRRSSMLMAPRKILPTADTTREDYIQALGLFAHEYFHSWNIKDLKPAVYQPYDLRAEQPNDLLWLFEGATAYFDHWLLVAAGVITPEEYWTALTKGFGGLNAHYRRPGRLHQTLSHCSLEAWTKLYNGGEDALNSSINYYSQGALFCLCLDAFLHRHGLRLAEILRGLWRQYRKDGVGLTEARFRDFVRAKLPSTAHAEWVTFLNQGLHSVLPLPLSEALSAAGLEFSLNPEPETRSDPGLRLQGGKVSFLAEGGPAARVGIAMGDEIIAVDGEKATPERLKRRLFASAPGREVGIHLFRDGLLRDYCLILEEAKPCCVHLKLRDPAAEQAWFRLGGAPCN